MPPKGDPNSDEDIRRLSAWLCGDSQGQQILRLFDQRDQSAKQQLLERLTAPDIPANFKTLITGGIVEKLFNIAKIEEAHFQVNIEGGSRITASLSGMVQDSPDYHKEVMDACRRKSVFPNMIEHLPAVDADAIQASLDLVDQANIYIGIFAHRYGYVPTQNNPLQISIAEMEYNRAVERCIPRLIFLMDENHPVHVDKGPSAGQLEALKNRLITEEVRNTFTTKEDLREKVILALGRVLVQFRHSVPTHFHDVRVPQPPKAYIAHRYMLLETEQVIGRQKELNVLTEWVTNPNTDPGRVRIFNLVAIGGMGKSALTWKWFNDIAPRVMQPLAGRMWWSFYDDASFENFVKCALAYVSQLPREAIEELSAADRESELLRFFECQPFLIVLDGLERLLIAYSRMDAAQLADDDLDERTAHRVAGAVGLSDSAAQSFVGRHHLRKCTDLRAGQFLKQMARDQATRTLISTRLYPAELETSNGDEIPGSKAHWLTGLLSRDALNIMAKESDGVWGRVVSLI